MSEFRAKPKRRLRHEIYSLLLMISIPLALAAVFPYEAIGFRVSEATPDPAPSCAFVTLTADEERQALIAARAAWQVNTEDVRGLRADLSVGELPATPMVRVLQKRVPGGAAAVRATVYEPSVLPPTAAAVAPADLPPDGEGRKSPAFSRDELLKVN